MQLTSGQLSVLRALNDFGQADDTALAVYVHHVADVPMSSSGIRTRRVELQRKGLVSVAGIKKLRSGRTAIVHTANKRGKAELARRDRAAQKAARSLA